MLDIGDKNSGARTLAVKQINRQAGYSLLSAWFSAHGTPPIREDVLTDACFLCGDLQGDYALCFVNRDPSSKFAWVQCPCSNPDNSPQKSKLAVTRLLLAVKETAIADGVTCLCVVTTTRSLIRLLKQIGFNSQSEQSHLFLNH